jgi:hypothetical protein
MPDVRKESHDFYFFVKMNLVFHLTLFRLWTVTLPSQKETWKILKKIYTFKDCKKTFVIFIVFLLRFFFQSKIPMKIELLENF